MRRRKLIWKLYPAYLMIILLSIATVTIYVSMTLKSFYLSKTADDLKIRSHLIERRVSAAFEGRKAESLDELCKTLGRASSTRITLVSPSGYVLGDSDEDPKVMENHASRPEIKKALTGQTGISTHYSETLQNDMMYVAIPLEKKGRIILAVRVAIPVSAIEIDKTLYAIFSKIALFGLFMAILAAVISFYIAKRISEPLDEIKRGAQRFAGGDLAHRLFVTSSEELHGLTDSLNNMAKQLGDKIRMITEQRNEFEAILSTMKEGVIAVDSEEHLIAVNKAAGALLGIDSGGARGHTIQEVIRSADTLRFIDGVLTGKGDNEAEIIFLGPENRILQMTGMLLRNTEGIKVGALVMLNDITRLRQLENTRREFVDNVSHELKTPITSIKGFVETLQEGAISDKENAQKFLAIISKQSDLLNSLIDDLLSLSGIEREAERGGMQRAFENLRLVLEAIVADYEPKTRERDIGIILNCSGEIMVKANSRLLKQAVGNLLDNAIKYTERGRTINIDVAKNEKEITIKVSDQGCGIAPEHLPRLFERFYRVDKGRSRELGGTGLGLAIVKHIIQAHAGRVTVESILGQGSTFTIHLPVG